MLSAPKMNSAQELGKELVRRWTHKHSDNEFEYDADQMDWCIRCRENHKNAAENGLACSKHPGSAFNVTCDGCDEENTNGK